MENSTGGIWDRFSNWIQQPQSQIWMFNAGKALDPEGLGGRISDAFMPSAKGAATAQAQEKEKDEQQKWSDYLSAPHVGAITKTKKPDGAESLTMKATPESELAKAEAIRMQKEAGQSVPILPVPSQIQQPAQPGPSMNGLPAAPPVAYTAVPGTDVPARFSAELAANPSSSPSRASSFGLSPEELLAAQKSAMELVAQPYRNALNASQTEHTGVLTERERLQLPLSQTHKVDLGFAGMPGVTGHMTTEQIAKFSLESEKINQTAAYHRALANGNIASANLHWRQIQKLEEDEARLKEGLEAVPEEARPFLKVNPGSAGAVFNTITNAPGKQAAAEAKDAEAKIRILGNQERDILSRHKPAGGLQFNPDGSVSLQSVSAAYEEMKRKAQAGDPQAKADLVQYGTVKAARDLLERQRVPELKPVEPGQTGIPTPAPSSAPSQEMLPPGVPEGSVKDEVWSKKVGYPVYLGPDGKYYGKKKSK